jgi:guanine nucleotide-binding protein G(i) subunit alpha
MPSVDDVLRSRVRTSGIIEEAYDIGGVEFVIYDVGGQRNERKKWIHCFDNVTAVIFVASLSEYDQVLFEDASINRMREAVNLFAEICNSKYFEHSSMILFLNKKDLFEKKIKSIDLRHEGGDGVPPRFLDYTGGCNYDAAKTYITNLFVCHIRA